MTRGINKVILLGNVGADPETRYTPGGNAVTNITLATSDTWKNKQTGQPQERTEWHRVAFFGKVAEIAEKYLKKGSKVYVEGRLQTRKWQDQQGQDRYTTEVVVDMGGTMQLLGSRDSESDTGQRQPRQQREPQQQAPRQQPQAGQQQPTPDYDSFDDDIPF